MITNIYIYIEIVEKILSKFLNKYKCQYKNCLLPQHMISLVLRFFDIYLFTGITVFSTMYRYYGIHVVFE